MLQEGQVKLGPLEVKEYVEKTARPESEKTPDTPRKVEPTQ
jgi:hypothetical protein